LAADRWVNLAVSAASSGRLKYHNADFRDRSFLVKEYLVLNEVLKDRVVEIDKADALISAIKTLDIRLDDSSHERLTNNLVNASAELFNTLLPWRTEKKDKVSPENKAVEMADMWKQIWGDPDDPEVKAKIDSSIKVLLRK
jgi:hypothetical protein